MITFPGMSDHDLYNRSPSCGHLGCFQALNFVFQSALVNILGANSSREYIFRTGIAGQRVDAYVQAYFLKEDTQYQDFITQSQ